MEQNPDITPIYGRGGDVLAWIDDAIVFDMCGRWVAFIDDGAMFSFKCKLLGFYEAVSYTHLTLPTKA